VKLLAHFIPILVYAQNLPEGEGRQLVEPACSVCHTLESVSSQRATRQAGKRLSRIWLSGARRQLIDYLAQNFPRASKVNVNKATAREIAATLEITGKEAKAFATTRGTWRLQGLGWLDEGPGVS